MSLVKPMTHPLAAADIELHVDNCNEKRISGWARYKGDPSQRVMLDLYINGKFHIRLVARYSRADLEQMQVGDGRYGFRYPLSPLLQNEMKYRLSLVDTRTQDVLFDTEIISEIAA